MSKHVYVRILSLSPCADDHAALADILQPYSLCRGATLPEAIKLLRSHQIGAVVCERDLPPYSWKDLLGAVTALPKPPLVIVTSQHADDYLWVEALNLGAYDVLAKPFVPAEVRRTVSFAALRWRCESQPFVMAAGAERRDFGALARPKHA